ncbi:hypothetical protein ABIF86_004811 [Bradyrhizobium japonicum]
MDPKDRFLDLVQIQSTTPDKSGTGWLVRPGLVLTALHCVADEKTWQRANAIDAYLWRELNEGKERPIAANVEWSLPVSTGRQPIDIALLSLAEAAMPHRPLQFADWPQDNLTAWTMGFPRAQAQNQGEDGLGEVNLSGTCSTLSRSPPAISFKSTIRMRTDNVDAWKGLSGGPLVVGEMIVGVMRRFPKGWDGTDQLEAEPLGEVLRQNKRLCELLGVGLPLRQARAATAAILPDEFRRLSEIIHFFDRTAVVGNVLDIIGKAVADGTSVEIIAVGEEQDRCDDLATRIHEEALASLLEDRTSGLLKVSWPESASDPVSAAETICLNAGRTIGLYPPWPRKWDDVAAKLQKHAVAPWFHISLPPQPTALDLHLVAEWRKCWAGIRRAGGEAAGYVLTFDGPPPNGILLESALRTIPSGLRSLLVRLGPHSLRDVRDWPSSIRTLSLQKVLRRERAVELETLARSLEPHVVSRGWNTFSQNDLHWLLQGQV